MIPKEHGDAMVYDLETEQIIWTGIFILEMQPFALSTFKVCEPFISASPMPALPCLIYSCSSFIQPFRLWNYTKT